MDSNYSGKDISHFILLYVGAIVSVYFLPNAIGYLYFGLLLILFWRSKKNAFWFMLFYFMLDPPYGLFPEDFNYGLPFIKGVNIRFIELFTYVAFLKALINKNRFQSLYYRSYQLLLVLTIILLVYTLLLNSFSVSFIITIKWLFVWSLVYSMPKLIDTYYDWVFAFRLSFIIVFIAFLSQLLQLGLGYSPTVLLGTNFKPMMDLNPAEYVFSKMDTAGYDILEARPISSSSIILMGLVGAMFFQQYKKNIFPKIYLYIVIIVSYVSILLTATRGWFIAFSVVIFLYFVFVQKIKRKAIIIIVGIIAIPILLSVPFVQKQLKGSFKRISTIEAVAQGDLSAGGTNARDKYSIELIDVWKESPWLGWGFSDVYKEYKNGHAGLANLLFGVGVIGFILFLYFWYQLFSIPITANRLISLQNPFKGSLIVFTLAFLIYFILNATSSQQFGIYLGFGQGVFSQILFYCYSSFFITMALKTDNLIKPSNTYNGYPEYYF